MSERGAATATATAATMVSDQAIAESLETLLRETNPRTPLTSFNSVVHHLESKLGIDLTHKLDFIRNQIHLLFNPSPNPNPPPPPPSHYHQQPHLQQPQQQQQQQNPNFHAAQPQNPNFRPQQPPLVKAETEPGVSDVAASGAATGLAESPKERSCKHLLNFISNPKPIGHQLARNGEGTTCIK